MADRTRRATGRDKLRRPTVPQAKLPVAYPYWGGPGCCSYGQGLARYHASRNRTFSPTFTDGNGVVMFGTVVFCEQPNNAVCMFAVGIVEE